MKRSLVPIIASVSSFGFSACGSESPQIIQDLNAIQSEILANDGCSVDPADIRIEDISALSITAFGDDSTGLAYTNSEGIKIDDDNSEEKAKELIKHEVRHWCSDQSESTQLAQPIEIPGVGLLTHTEGFLPFLNHSNDQPNVVVEEGVVDWLAWKDGNYTLHPDYMAIATLTDILSQKRGFTTETITKLHNTDDLIGFVALVKAIDKSAVTGNEVLDVILLYQETAFAKAVPDEAAIDSYIDG